MAVDLSNIFEFFELENQYILTDAKQMGKCEKILDTPSVQNIHVYVPSAFASPNTHIFVPNSNSGQQQSFLISGIQRETLVGNIMRTFYEYIWVKKTKRVVQWTRKVDKER